MNAPATDLLAHLSAIGVTVGVEGGRLWYKPRSAAPAELVVQMRSLKGELVEALGTKLTEAVAPSDAENEFYWQQVKAEDQVYLLGPRNWPDPCVWCGGRLRHSSFCHDLQKSWESELTFGKHKGRRISDVPLDYLLWLRGNARSLDPDIRAAIERKLSPPPRQREIRTYHQQIPISKFLSVSQFS